MLTCIPLGNLFLHSTLYGDTKMARKKEYTNTHRVDFPFYRTHRDILESLFPVVNHMSWLSEPQQQEEMEDMVILRHATLMGRKLAPLPAIYRYTNGSYRSQLAGVSCTHLFYIIVSSFGFLRLLFSLSLASLCLIYVALLDFVLIYAALKIYYVSLFLWRIWERIAWRLDLGRDRVLTDMGNG